MSTKIGVALVGFGYAGETFHFPLIQATEGLEVRLIYSSKLEEAKVKTGVKVTSDFGDILADRDIELVVIATPNELHFEQAKAALNAGKNVVIDKPFALNPVETKSLLDLAKSKNLFATCFFNRRWDGDFVAVTQLIRSGEIGEVNHFESSFDRFRPIVQDRWREKGSVGGGLWYDIGPHLLDQAIYLFGEPRGLSLHTATIREGASNDDWFHALIEFENMRAIIRSSAMTIRPNPRFIVHGSTGSLIKRGLDEQETSLKAKMDPNNPKFNKDRNKIELFREEDMETAAEQINCDYGAYIDFYKAIFETMHEGAILPVTPAQIETVAKWHDIGLKSAREKQTIII